MQQHPKIHPVNNSEASLPQETKPEITVLPMVASPMDQSVERFSNALTRREDNRKALLKWIRANLKSGVDFGQIHIVGKDKCRLAREGRVNECIDPRHWSKPSLWKPGAEKICGMLGLIPRFPNLSEYENAVLRGEDIKMIILKCELHTGNGFIAAEGTGARRVAQDHGDINKSLKMTEKSAHIDATLRVAGLSELFTQDLEDMTGGSRPEAPLNDGQRTQPGQNRNLHERDRSQPNPPSSNGQGNRITGKQYRFIMDLVKEAGMSKQELNRQCIEAYGSVLDHITRADASSLIDWLRRR